MGVLSGVVAISKRSGGSGMRLCGATGLAQPRLIGRLLRSSGPSPACPPTRGATGQVPTCGGATGR